MFGKNRNKQDGADLIYADTHAQETPPQPEGRPRRRLGAAVIALAVALAAALGVVTLVLWLNSREASYARAKELAAGKAYSEALTAFEELGDYRDSRTRAAELAAQQEAYETALALLEQQRYEEAAAAFRALGDYADSARMAAFQVTYQKALDLMTQIDTGKTHLLTRILTDQVRLTDEKSYPTVVGYETAAALLESLGDYRSAPALVDRCYYSAGLVKLGWEDWDGALECMAKMSEETALEFYEEYLQYYSQKVQEGQ